MTNNDYAVGAVNTLTNVIPSKIKPSYLILLEPPQIDKTKKLQKFIATDKPEFLNNFINVKGFFCNSSEEKIVENYTSILTDTPKDLYLELVIPSHRIISIQSLVFKQK